MIKRLCIIGVGLIGGSLARALKQKQACDEVVGTGRQVQNLQKALDLGVIDRFETDISLAVKGADMVVVAVPVGSMEAVFRQIKPHVTANTIITDVGSTKRSVEQAARQVWGELPATFVPAHPIAGTEKSGVEASFPELFHKRRVIITPTNTSSMAAIETVKSMWELTGADVVEMEIDHHDQVLAATSHLPHLLAFTLVDTLSRMDDKAEIFEFAAGGFRDFTRIASSDPDMWRDICLSNSGAILQMLDRFVDDLERLGAAIKANDQAYVMSVFSRAKQARDGFCNR